PVRLRVGGPVGAYSRTSTGRVSPGEGGMGKLSSPGPELSNRADATSCGSAGLPPPVGGDPPQAASSTTPRALSGGRVRIVPIMYTRLRFAGFLVLVYPRTCDAAFRDTSGQARRSSRECRPR